MNLGYESAREMCTPCPINSITQGSIFNYAYNEDFGGLDDLGLIISARCDLANNKAPKYSYLPVVKLEKFINREIIKKLFSEKINQNITQIKQLVNNEGHSPDAVDLYGADAASNKLLTNVKNQNKAKILLEENIILQTKKNKPWENINKDDYSLVSKKNLKKELEAISENKVEGYFFIDNIVDHNDEKKNLGPHIVLLREIHHINPELVKKIKSGADHSELKKINGASGSLKFHDEGFTYILCNIKSPYIELLMQRFSNLFSRIGVANPEKIMIEKLASTYFPPEKS